MRDLEDLHNQIAQLLVNAGPADAKTIIARAKLALDGESCEYEYDYIDQRDNENWFVPDKLASYHLRLLLVNLRDYYIQNNRNVENKTKPLFPIPQIMDWRLQDARHSNPCVGVS